MALINCKECTTQFSDLAAACPKCGAPTAYSKGSAAVSISKDNSPTPYAGSNAPAPQDNGPVVINGTARTVIPEAPPVQQPPVQQATTPQQQMPQQQVPQQAIPPQHAIPPQQTMYPQGYAPQQHIQQPGTQPFQMHQQIIINTPAPQPQIRYVGSLLLIGIFFFPWIFYWFLFRNGHTNFARAAGFIWLVLCTAAFLALDYSVYKMNQAANEATTDVVNSTDLDTTSSNSKRESILYRLANEDKQAVTESVAEPAPIATSHIDMDAFNEPATAPVDPADQAINDAVQVTARPTIDEAAGDAISECIASESNTGNYSSFDGGKSAMRMMTGACLQQFKNWTDSCVATGQDRGDCNVKATLLAQTALKMSGN